MKLQYFFTLFLFLFLFLNLGEAVPYKLNLSGGSGGTTGQYTYYAPNGTVVTSSAKVYSNGSYYYMGYLFNESYANRLHTDYWLTTSVGTQTLTFSLNTTYYLDRVRVYAAAYKENWTIDRRSNYMVEVSADGSTFTNITGSYVNTYNDALGSFHDHSILQNTKYVRFTLTREGSYGVTLNEIELYVDTAPTPALYVDNPSFGNVRVGTSASTSLTVTNTGTGTLIGSTGPASGSEFSPTSGSTSFSLGQNQASSRSFTYTPSSRGTNSTQVSVTSNAGSLNRTITGTGVSPVFSSSIAPNTTIDFGEIDQTGTKTLTISNTTPDDDLSNLTNLTLLSATITGVDASYFSLENFTPGMVLTKNSLANLLLRFTNYNNSQGIKNAILTLVTDQNAAYGTSGDTFTFYLQAMAIPEPHSFALMIVFLCFAIFFYNQKIL